MDFLDVLAGVLVIAILILALVIAFSTIESKDYATECKVKGAVMYIEHQGCVYNLTEQENE